MTMLFHVTMDVNIPRDLPADQRTDILAREKAYSQDLQRAGTWRHIWRVAGQYANVSIFDVSDNAELHDILSGLALFPIMTIRVTPSLGHPRGRQLDDTGVGGGAAPTQFPK